MYNTLELLGANTKAKVAVMLTNKSQRRVEEEEEEEEEEAARRGIHIHSLCVHNVQIGLTGDCGDTLETSTGIF